MENIKEKETFLVVLNLLLGDKVLNDGTKR